MEFSWWITTTFFLDSIDDHRLSSEKPIYIYIHMHIYKPIYTPLRAFGVFRKGGTPIAGWFICWNILFFNGWELGVPPF
jgi:hypothetical protein